MSTGDVPGPWLPSPSPHPQVERDLIEAFTRLSDACREALAALERRGTRGPRPVRPKRQHRPNAVRPLGTPPYQPR